MKVESFSSLLFFFGDLERGCRSTKIFWILISYSVIQTYVIMGFFGGKFGGKFGS